MGRTNFSGSAHICQAMPYHCFAEILHFSVNLGKSFFISKYMA